MKRILMNKFVIGLFAALLALPAMAQEDELKDLPGYVDFGDLSATYGDPKITINLGGTMLDFVGIMSQSDSPETSDLISKLKGNANSAANNPITNLFINIRFMLLSPSSINSVIGWPC